MLHRGYSGGSMVPALISSLNNMESRTPEFPLATPTKCSTFGRHEDGRVPGSTTTSSKPCAASTLPAATQDATLAVPVTTKELPTKCNVLPLYSEMNINHACKLFEVILVNGYVFSADGGESLGTTLDNLFSVANKRDGRSCKLSKVPWLLCIEKASSTASRVDSVPGCDMDKREKIIQKNEKVHKWQKERRVQELHERCKGYLMSRKLEVLARKIVALSFSSDQATMASTQAEDCVRESATWFCNFDVSEEAKHQLAAANLKIDIVDEPEKIVSLEAKYKQQVVLAQNPTRLQVNEFYSVGGQQMRREDKDLNYKLLIYGSGPKEPALKGFQPLDSQPKQELHHQQFIAPEKR